MTADETIAALTERVAHLERQLKRYKPNPRYPAIGPADWALVDDILAGAYITKSELLSTARYPYITEVRFRIYRALFEAGRHSTTQIARMLGKETSGVRYGILTDRRRYPNPTLGAKYLRPVSGASRDFLREDS